MAQRRCSAMALAAMLAICAFVAVQSVSAATPTTHNVGDSNGWRLPATIPGGFNYTVWANNQAYYTGDKLFFAYPAASPPAHTVWSVTGEDFRACNTTASPLFSDKGAGNTTFSLDNEGNYWFFCSVGQHCANGMKFKITVQTSAALSLSASFLYTVAAVAATMAVLGAMVV